MKRVAAIVATCGLLVAVSTSAGAETPSGTFSSPSRAAGGSPIWVRSITPCPTPPNPYAWAHVFIAPQTDPGGAELEATDTDLRADGSWEVTLTVPTAFDSGATKSYSIHAQCISDSDPYGEPPSTTASTSTTTTSTSSTSSTSTTSTSTTSTTVASSSSSSYFRYFLRSLTVTSSGSSASAPASGASGTTSNASATTATTAPTTFAAASYASATATIGTKVARFIDDQAERIAEARHELALQQRASASHDVALVAQPTSSQTRPVDGGMPWWSFALAAILATGAVVGYGVRRKSSI